MNLGSYGHSPRAGGGASAGASRGVNVGCGYPAGVKNVVVGWECAAWRPASGGGRCPSRGVNLGWGPRRGGEPTPAGGGWNKGTYGHSPRAGGRASAGASRGGNVGWGDPAGGKSVGGT